MICDFPAAVPPTGLADCSLRAESLPTVLTIEQGTPFPMAHPGGFLAEALCGHESTELSRAVDLVIVRTLVLAERYGFRHELRAVIQHKYRRQQEDGYLP